LTIEFTRTHERDYRSNVKQSTLFSSISPEQTSPPQGKRQLAAQIF